MIAEVCPVCGESCKLRCEYCDGAGGEWVIFGGEKIWDECSVCRGSGVHNCYECGGEGRA